MEEIYSSQVSSLGMTKLCSSQVSSLGGVKLACKDPEQKTHT
mgnify:CR=1 FL=1